MTSEGYLMFFMLLLVVAKYVFDFKKDHAVQVLGRFKKKLLFPVIILLVINISVGLYITDQIAGILLLNSLVWTYIFYLSGKYGYTLIFWFIFLIYQLDISAAYVYEPELPNPEIWFYTLMCIQITAFIILLYDVGVKKAKYIAVSISWIVLCTAFIFPLIFLAYYFKFDKKIQNGQINAIFQTNIRESYEYMLHYTSFAFIIVFAVIAIGIFYLLKKAAHSPRVSMPPLMFCSIIFFLLITVNLDISSRLNLPTFVEDSFESYKHELEKFKEELQKRKSEVFEFNAVKPAGAEPEIYYVIIGESLNKNHMGLYGYHRNTTPYLSSLYESNSIIKYENVFACHTHTVDVLTKAFTQANNVNQKKYYESISIIDVFNKADFDTYWISNQVRVGVWDNAVTALAEQCKHKYFINTNIGLTESTMYYDGKVVDVLKNVLKKKVEKNTVVFIHLMGSHVFYQNRYPSGAGQFEGLLSKSEYGNVHQYNPYVNHYDNSVLYNDRVVNDIITAAMAHENAGALLYFSDHSEEVLHQKSHEASQFTFSMSQIPFLLCLSETYKNNYPVKAANILVNKDIVMPNDYVYDMLIGITGIETDSFDITKDITGTSLSIKTEEMIPLGGFNYKDSLNHFYYQKITSAAVDSLDQRNRVIPHRVNSIGKLSDIFYTGHRAFEVDLLFRKEQSGDFYFEVGHDEGAMAGMNFRKMLERNEYKNITKIWLDIKNLDSANIHEALQELHTLDKEFKIKNKVIVESGCTHKHLALIKAAGFHTSYYLPTNIQILQPSALAATAAQLAVQLQQQDVSAVSFDRALYTFVKQYLEPILNEKIVYHTWDVNIRFNNPDFKEKLLLQDYFNDGRIQTVLIPYLSEFEN